MIVQKADTAGFDLNRNVAVSQMVAGARQQVRIVAADDGESFDGSFDLHPVTLRAGELIPVFQRCATFQKEPGVSSVVQGDPQTALDAAVQRQGQRAICGSCSVALFYQFNHDLDMNSGI